MEELYQILHQNLKYQIITNTAGFTVNLIILICLFVYANDNPFVTFFVMLNVTFSFLGFLGLFSLYAVFKKFGQISSNTLRYPLIINSMGLTLLNFSECVYIIILANNISAFFLLISIIAGIEIIIFGSYFTQLTSDKMSAIDDVGRVEGQSETSQLI